MDLRFVLLICALVVAAVLVEGHGRGRGSSERRAARRNRHNQGDYYVWSRSLGGNNAAQQTAYAQTDKNQINMKSTNDSLSPAGFTKSTVLYDFTGASQVIAITLAERRRGSPCYVITPTSTYQEFINILAQRNGTVAPLGSQVVLHGSHAPLSRDEAQVLLASNPSLRRACKGGKIVRPSETPAEVSEGTEVIKVFTIDQVIDLTVSTASSRTRGSRRSGSRGHRRTG